MNRVYRIALFAFAALLIASTSFVAGAAVQRLNPWWSTPIGIDPPEASGLGNRLEEVEAILQKEALTPSSVESATAGAVSGLLRSLEDTYAAYFDMEHWKYFQEQNDGEFFGIGVTISQRDRTVFIVSVIEDTPAEGAGLQADDEIVSIDGDRKDSWDVDEVVKRIRGPEGTFVDVGVYRPADKKELTFHIERARIDIPNVMSRMEGDVGYIRLLSFNEKSANELAAAIDELGSEGAESFVLDVRDNPGGLLQSAVDVASLFVSDGVLVRVEYGDGSTEEYRASGNTATDKPLVVLMNGNSASASEVLAGALQDYSRATLVGERSFGKASVQTVKPLTFGGGIKFTIAHYLTPKDRAIDGVGLDPDVKVEMDAALQEDPATDTQLQRALELARERQ